MNGMIFSSIVMYGLLMMTCYAGIATEVGYSNAAHAAHQGNWQKAYDQYNQLLINNPDRPDLLYDAGVAAYRLGKFDTACAYLQRAVQQDNVADNLKEQAYFNLGNVDVAQKKLEDAIDAYQEVLVINPDNERAKHNLEKVQEMLKQQQEEQKDEQKKDDKKQDKNKQDKNKQQDKQDKKNQENQQKQDQEQQQDNQKQDQKNENQQDEQHDNQRDKEQGDQQSQHEQQGQSEQEKQQDQKENADNEQTESQGQQPQDSGQQQEQSKNGKNQDKSRDSGKEEQLKNKEEQSNHSDNQQGKQQKQQRAGGAQEDTNGNNKKMTTYDQLIEQVLQVQENTDAKLNKIMIKQAVDKNMDKEPRHGQHNW
jgi:Ca-activated chloride channel homolog